jgi:hypothetical protein
MKPGMYQHQAFRAVAAFLSAVMAVVFYCIGIAKCPTPGHCTIHESDAQYWAATTFMGLLCYYLYDKWKTEAP